MPLPFFLSFPKEFCFCLTAAKPGCPISGALFAPDMGNRRSLHFASHPGFAPVEMTKLAFLNPILSPWAARTPISAPALKHILAAGREIGTCNPLHGHDF